MTRVRVLLPLVLAALALSIVGIGCRNGDSADGEPTGQQTPPAGKQRSTLDRLVRSGKLAVGYVAMEPCVIKDPNTGELTGHLVDTVEFIAKQADLEISYHEESWSTFVAGLHTGRYDLSIAPTFATIPRSKSVAFTIPLFMVGNSMIVAKGETRFKDVMDLDQDGVVVAVTNGEAGHEFAQSNFTVCKIKVLPSPDQSLTMSEVSVGRADAALGDAYATKKYAAEHPEVTDLLADRPYNITPAAWAVRHGDVELLSFINTAIQFCEATGKLQEFEVKAGAHWLHPEKKWVVRSTLEH